MSKRNGKASSNITFEDSNEELIDEINSFHSKDRAIAKGAIQKKKRWTRPEEVLNVEGEASESSGDEEDGSDFDDDDDEDLNDVTDNKWGKKRKDFYGTGYVDEDYGGMREEEVEDAELEEEDALSRQKLIDKSTAAIADLFDDDEEEEVDEVVQVDTTLEFNETNAKKTNKKTSKLIEQYEARKRIFDLVVRPLENVIQLMPKCALRTQIVYVAQTYASYLMNVAFFLKLKASQFEKGKLNDPLIDIHPVGEAIAKLNKKIVECEDYLHTNSDQLDELKLWAKSTPKKIEGLCSKFSEVTLKKTKTNGVEKISTLETSEDVSSKNPAFASLNEEEKRKAADKIAKNKAYLDKKGKKKAKTSKTKNRRKVHAIEKRVKSQIGNVRKEMQKYSGETTGIRASTIKSTKLIA